MAPLHQVFEFIWRKGVQESSSKLKIISPTACIQSQSDPFQYCSLKTYEIGENQKVKLSIIPVNYPQFNLIPDLGIAEVKLQFLNL